ncbi:MAG: Asp-tRNA(Asn)/Glu-tRNA(Gln) amidotransferase GatCAB subunit C [Planctomycetaceae bacterium]|nr:Asp-tRNA(Asn)/Glu-tRNA(Gln) amidotransferase GatCAB subunit C [Planctomycetaceae bacterium]
MSLTRQDVEKVALLAKLKFDDDQLDRMTDHMIQIVEYVEKLSELNTQDVEPMAHALDIYNALAEDEPRPGLTREAALGNAPKSDEEYFRVPAVLGE